MKKYYFQRQFSFERSISRSALEKIYDLIYINTDSTDAFLFRDPQVGIWSYEVEIQSNGVAIEKYRSKIPHFHCKVYSQVDRLILTIHDDDDKSILVRVIFDLFFEKSYQEHLHPACIFESRFEIAKRYIFPKKASSIDVFDALCQTENLGLTQLEIRERDNRVYAYYAEYNNKPPRKRHDYAKTWAEHLGPGEQFSKIEIFCKDGAGILKWRAICEKKPCSIPLDGDKLYYKYSKGTADSLLVYFDYSRSTEKVKLYEEYLPPFNMRTESSVLVIANVFGHWGTATSFSSNGKLIVDDVLKFILQKFTISGAKRIYIIGGSQGGSAALLYGSLLPLVEQIHAAVPVPFSTKSMLMHLKYEIHNEDIAFCDSKMLEAFLYENVFLYSTRGDIACDWHCKLAASSHKVAFTLCEDMTVLHGDCLRHYIKNIYKSICKREDEIKHTVLLGDVHP